MPDRIILKNGVRIVFERIPYVRSVSAGVWVGTGSRYETAAENGSSHFIEHMVFKGTGTRTAAQLAEAMDEIGGQINAFTTKECTCFYGRVLDTHLRKLTDILCDMLFDSLFDEADTDNERGVIFEEIDMYEDTPEDLVSERLFTAVYRGSALARPILGKKSTLSKITGTDLRGYMKRHYCPESLVVSVSGSFDDAELAYIERRFGEMPPGGGNRLVRAKYKPAVVVKKKAIEQNHLCIGFPCIAADDERRYAVQLLSSALGGGMSSRLFQSVREKRGLCYSVYTFLSSYIDTGLFSVYVALSADSEREAIGVIRDEIALLKKDGVSEEELSRVREQAKANILMSLESTSSRMTRMGKNELFMDRLISAEELIEAYDAVTPADVAAAACEFLDFDRVSLSAVGRVAEAERYADAVGGER